LVKDAVKISVKGSSSASQMQFLQLALSGKKADFSKIVKMMDDMVGLLKEEQKDDEAKKEYCEAEFETSEDKEGELKRSIKALATELEETAAAISGLKDDIAGLTQGIKDLDTSVAEATATRKEESTDFTNTKATNSGAVQLLEVAKNQLNKFYNPKSYKKPERRDLTEEERIYVNSGGMDPRDAEEAAKAQTGIAGTGIGAFIQLSAKLTEKGAPPPPPMAIEAYKKSDSSGPIALMDNFMNDIKMEMQEDDMNEKQAQKDYESLMQDSADKRALDSKTIVEKEEQKAEAEGKLSTAKKNHKDESAELLALGEYISNLHGDCDFLVNNFDLRRDARTNEIEAIGKAKAVLSGADYSLLQTETKTTREYGFLQKHAAQCEGDQEHRVSLLQSLRQMQKNVNEACVEMCKTLGAYPKCDCPDFVEPDTTPGVVTWDELYGIFDDLKQEGRDMLKKYNNKVAAQ